MHACLFLTGACQADIKGRIVDADTKRPISDVMVVATWKEGLIHGSGCAKLSVAVTDYNGEYSLKEPPLKPLFTYRSQPRIYAHKEGYRLGAVVRNTTNTSTVGRLEIPAGRLHWSSSNDDQRIKYLNELIRLTSCYGAGRDNSKKYPLYKAILDEAMALASTINQRIIVKKMCKEVAQTATRVERHPTNTDKRVEAFINEHLPACTKIKADPAEQKKLLITLLSNNEKRIRKLVDSGVNIDMRFKRNRTALMIAINKREEEKIPLLVRLGANPNLMDDSNLPILQQVISSLDFSESSKARIVAALLKNGANPMVTDAWNKTPLFTATERGAEKVVLELIKVGVNVNDRDIGLGNVVRDRDPAIIHARTTGLTKILLDAGADPNLDDGHGYTALHAAAGAGNLKVVKLLLDAGADVNATGSSSGWGPLRSAESGFKSRPNLKVSYLKVVEMLLDAGADVHQEDSHGNSVLFYAEDKELKALLKRYK